MITYTVYEWDIKNDREYVLASDLALEDALTIVKLKPHRFLRRLEIERNYD